MPDEDDAPFIREAIAWPSFRSVSSKESWTTKRREHWAEVRRRIEAELLERAVRREIEAVADLETLKVLVLARSTGNEAMGVQRVRPRYLEGMIRAYMAWTGC